MLYNSSEFITLIKEDIGIKDIPLPVDDNDLLERFTQSALKEFSVRSPRLETVVIGTDDAIDKTSMKYNGAIVYRIPKFAYEGSMILAVTDLQQGDRSGAAASLYMPSVVMGTMDNLLASVSDIKMAASMGSMMTHAPTYRFMPPDKLTIYDGWTGANFTVEMALLHDPNLSTVPPTAMTHLRQLAILDIEAYLYNKLKRKENLDVGIGTINLNIQSWENAQQEMRDLLKSWDDEGANLDIASIHFY